MRPNRPAPEAPAATGPRIARADLARFMLQQLDDPAHVRASPVISN